MLERYVQYRVWFQLRGALHSGGQNRLRTPDLSRSEITRIGMNVDRVKAAGAVPSRLQTKHLEQMIMALMTFVRVRNSAPNRYRSSILSGSAFINMAASKRSLAAEKRAAG